MVIVGLGNPGLKYKETRHNIGFMFVDKLAECYHASFVLDKQKEAMIAEIYIDNKKHLLIKPVTYMNNSGNAVSKILNYWNISPNDLLVVYDDMDLEVGKIRIRKMGSAGGHNGMKSIIAHLQTQDFKRIRIGIGRSEDNIEHVLGKFKPNEKKLINESLEIAPLLFNDYLTKGIEYIMNRYN